MVKYYFLLLLSIPGTLSAQITLIYKDVKMLSKSVNSDYEESMPLLSPDGTTLYFTRFLSPANKGGEYSGTDVWMSRYDVTKFDWGRPDNTKIENTPGNNAVVGIAAKGDMVYLQNTVASRDVFGIYFSKKVGNQWTQPELIPMKGLASEGFLGIYVSPDFDVIFLSMKGNDSRGEEDLYISIKNVTGQWSEPKNLGATINTTGFEISPFLSADKTKLYFSSSGHAGQGDADIFVSERQYGSWEVWSQPKNLGQEVNSKKFDAYFSSYGDSVFYFSSNRAGKMSDIYQGKIIIDDGKKDQMKVDSLVNQTKDLLNQLRTSTKSMVNFEGSKNLISFDDNVSRVQADSEEMLEGYANYMTKNVGVRLFLEYDSRAMDVTKAQQKLTQDRIRRIKQILKSYGIAESRIIISSAWASTKPDNVRRNAVQLSILR
jgi:outer membrane protein OmpA-like peptidoglycan-associated protein